MTFGEGRGARVPALAFFVWAPSPEKKGFLVNPYGGGDDGPCWPFVQ